MSWTYDVTALASNVKDQIRLRIGDTDELDPVLQDEEILFYIAQDSDLTRATSACVDVMLTRLTSTPDYTLGPYSESNTNRLKALTALKTEYSLQLRSGAPLMHRPTTEAIFSYDMMSQSCCQKPEEEV